MDVKAMDLTPQISSRLPVNFKDSPANKIAENKCDMIISSQVLDKVLKEQIRAGQPAGSKGEKQTKPHWK